MKTLDLEKVLDLSEPLDEDAMNSCDTSVDLAEEVDTIDNSGTVPGPPLCPCEVESAIKAAQMA